MNEVIIEKISEFTLDDYRPIHSRELDLGSPRPPRLGNLVTVITGMRRSGKTYRLFQEMDSLLEVGVSADRMLYFNFEDERLGDIDPSTGDAVLETYYSMNPDALDEGAYLFLDELQEMSDWGKWMRRIVDTRKVTIYCTGSSSKMLSSDISTEFRGRSIAYELLPLSFSEYLRFHQREDLLGKKGSTLKARLGLQNLLERYLARGGFPGVQDLTNPQAVSVLQDYVQRVIARDVIERHDISSPRVVSAFAQAVVAANGRTLSMRKIANDFRSRGMKVTRALLGDCLGYFADAYLISTVRERSRALREKDNALPKVYAVDMGLVCANAPASVVDAGQRLEEAVYLELRRRLGVDRNDSISFLRTKGHGYEVDFVVGDALFDEGLELYQVAVSLDDPAVLERETRALYEAMEELDVEGAHLIVQEGMRDTLERDGRSIAVVPARDWLLGAV